MPYDQEEKCNQLFELTVSNWKKASEVYRLEDQGKIDEVYVGLLTDIIATCRDHSNQ